MNKEKHIGRQFTMHMVPSMIFTITDYNSTTDNYRIQYNGYTNHIDGREFDVGIIQGNITLIPGKVDISLSSSTKVVPKVEKINNYFSFDDI